LEKHRTDLLVARQMNLITLLIERGNDGPGAAPPRVASRHGAALAGGLSIVPADKAQDAWGELSGCW